MSTELQRHDFEIALEDERLRKQDEQDGFDALYWNKKADQLLVDIGRSIGKAEQLGEDIADTNQC